MNRRRFLHGGLIAPLAVQELAARVIAPAWRSFEFVCQLDIIVERELDRH
jgi:hypothetical protein